jgi:SAM-dependent methyltransferase
MDVPYPLGHASEEVARLMLQGAFYRDLTDDFLRHAGIERGMRVLDVGCGVGDVTLLAAELVGPFGVALGIDRGEAAVAVAAERAACAGVDQVQFQVADAATVVLDEPVDAVIGRLVLMYQPDPAAVLRHLAAQARPGGVVAFQEMDIAAMGADPPCPLVDETRRWLLETFALVGADPRAGIRLHRHFGDAGLAAPRLLAAARLGREPNDPIYDMAVGIIRTLLPAIERTGVATAAEVDGPTLGERMRREVVAADAVIRSPDLIGAWARTVA